MMAIRFAGYRFANDYQKLNLLRRIEDEINLTKITTDFGLYSRRVEGCILSVCGL